jgi:DhnA family fructose-bisphosphate aldolase class Ia
MDVAAAGALAVGAGVSIGDIRDPYKLEEVDEQTNIATELNMRLFKMKSHLPDHYTVAASYELDSFTDVVAFGVQGPLQAVNGM